MEPVRRGENILLTKPLPLQILSDARSTLFIYFAVRYSAPGQFHVYPAQGHQSVADLPDRQHLPDHCELRPFFYPLSLQFTLTPRAYAAVLSSYSTGPARPPGFLAGHGTFRRAFLPICEGLF